MDCLREEDWCYQTEVGAGQVRVCLWWEVLGLSTVVVGAAGATAAGRRALGHVAGHHLASLFLGMSSVGCSECVIVFVIDQNDRIALGIHWPFL